MGSNYPGPTGAPAAANQYGQQGGQNQGGNAPNTGAVPTTYGGVERANQLLRNLQEQPQASAEYNPSGQQGYQQGQQGQYNPSAQGAAGGNNPRGGAQGYDAQAAARVDTRQAAAGYQTQGQQAVAAQTAYRGQEAQPQTQAYQPQGQGQTHQQTSQGQPQGQGQQGAYRAPAQTPAAQTGYRQDAQPATQAQSNQYSAGGNQAAQTGYRQDTQPQQQQQGAAGQRGAAAAAPWQPAQTPAVQPRQNEYAPTTGAERGGFNGRDYNQGSQTQTHQTQAPAAQTYAQPAQQQQNRYAQPTPSVAPGDVRYKAPAETPAQYTPQNQYTPAAAKPAVTQGGYQGYQQPQVQAQQSQYPQQQQQQYQAPQQQYAAPVQTPVANQYTPYVTPQQAPTGRYNAPQGQLQQPYGNIAASGPTTSRFDQHATPSYGASKTVAPLGRDVPPYGRHDTPSGVARGITPIGGRLPPSTYDRNVSNRRRSRSRSPARGAPREARRRSRSPVRAVAKDGVSTSGAKRQASRSPPRKRKLDNTPIRKVDFSTMLLSNLADNFNAPAISSRTNELYTPDLYSRFPNLYVPADFVRLTMDWTSIIGSIRSDITKDIQVTVPYVIESNPLKLPPTISPYPVPVVTPVVEVKPESAAVVEVIGEEAAVEMKTNTEETKTEEKTEVSTEKTEEKVEAVVVEMKGAEEVKESVEAVKVEEGKIEVAVPPEEEAIPANVYGLEVPKFTYVTPGPLEGCGQYHSMQPKPIKLNARVIVTLGFKDSESERVDNSLPRKLRVLCGRRKKAVMLLGGSWCADLDGGDPLVNRDCLINTARRAVFSQSLLDIFGGSGCSSNLTKLGEINYQRPQEEMYGKVYPEQGEYTAIYLCVLQPENVMSEGDMADFGMKWDTFMSRSNGVDVGPTLNVNHESNLIACREKIHPVILDEVKAEVKVEEVETKAEAEVKVDEVKADVVEMKTDDVKVEAVAVVKEEAKGDVVPPVTAAVETVAVVEPTPAPVKDPENTLNYRNYRKKPEVPSVALCAIPLPLDIADNASKANEAISLRVLNLSALLSYSQDDSNERIFEASVAAEMLRSLISVSFAGVISDFVMAEHESLYNQADPRILGAVKKLREISLNASIKAKKEAEAGLKAIAEQEAKLAAELAAANPTEVKEETDGKVEEATPATDATTTKTESTDATKVEEVKVETDGKVEEVKVEGVVKVVEVVKEVVTEVVAVLEAKKENLEVKVEDLEIKEGNEEEESKRDGLGLMDAKEARGWRRYFVSACRWFDQDSDARSDKFLRADHLQLILQSAHREVSRADLSSAIWRVCKENDRLRYETFV